MPCSGDEFLVLRRIKNRRRGWRASSVSTRRAGWPNSTPGAMPLSIGRSRLSLTPAMPTASAHYGLRSRKLLIRSQAGVGAPKGAQRPNIRQPSWKDDAHFFRLATTVDAGYESPLEPEMHLAIGQLVTIDGNDERVRARIAGASLALEQR